MDKLVVKLTDVLKNLGYSPDVYEIRNHHYEISFISFGFDAFPSNHKNVIRTLTGERLIEFNYELNTQYILIRK